jgi:hypothetical protein
VLEEIYHVGFEVLTAVTTKMAVFWVVAPCSLVEVYQVGFEVLTAVNTKMAVYQTTQRYNPEDSHL